MFFLFPLLSVVKWWSHCISEQTNQAQVSKSSSVHKPFFPLFPSTFALGKGMGTPRDQSLQGAHQRLFYLRVAFVQQVTNRFSPSDHPADVCLLIGGGRAERKQNRAPDLVQWRGAGGEMLWFSCTWALHTGNASRAPGAIPGASGMTVPAGSGWEAA